MSITIQTHPKKFNTVYLLFKKKCIGFLKVIDVNKEQREIEIVY